MAAGETPFMTEAARLAVAQRFEAAAHARYGTAKASPLAASPAAPASSLTADTATARIREIRAELATVTNGRRHDELVGELGGAYRVLHPEPVGEAPPAARVSETPEQPAAEPEPDRLPELPAGVRWDHGAVLDVYETVAREGLPIAEFHQGLALAAQLAASPMPTPEAAEATLRATWGGDYDVTVQAARSVAKRLPPGVLDYLDATGLGDHPAMIEHFAGLAARMPAKKG
jgi:hypothetical protein